MKFYTWQAFTLAAVTIVSISGYFQIGYLLPFAVFCIIMAVASNTEGQW